MTDWTPQDQLDAQRDAIAVALAAWRDDIDGIGALWKGSARREALLHALARLPSTLLRAASEREGYTVDPEEVLTGLLRDLPLTIDPEEEDE